MSDDQSWFSRINYLGDWDYRILDWYYCYQCPELRLVKSVADRAKVCGSAQAQYFRRSLRPFLLMIPVIVVANYLSFMVIPRVARTAGLTQLPPRVLAFFLVLSVWGAYAFVLNRYFFNARSRAAIRAELNARGIPVCMKCGYDLRGQLEPRCPECGEPEKKS